MMTKAQPRERTDGQRHQHQHQHQRHHPTGFSKHTSTTTSTLAKPGVSTTPRSSSLTAVTEIKQTMVSRGDSASATLAAKKLKRSSATAATSAAPTSWRSSFTQPPDRAAFGMQPLVLQEGKLEGNVAAHMHAHESDGLFGSQPTQIVGGRPSSTGMPYFPSSLLNLQPEFIGDKTTEHARESLAELKTLSPRTNFVLFRHPADLRFSILCGDAVVPVFVNEETLTVAVAGSDEYQTLNELILALTDSEVANRTSLPEPLFVRDKAALSQSPREGVPALDHAAYKKMGSANEHADVGEPWTVADVCDWLVSIGLADIVPPFQHHRIDGEALLELKPADLQSLGVKPDTAEILYSHIKTLQTMYFGHEVSTSEDADADTKDGVYKKWMRATYVIRESADTLKVFDAVTHEEIYDFEKDLLRLLAENRPYSMEAPDYDVEDVDFVWSGDKKGWLRRFPNNSIVEEGLWNEEDLCSWLEFVGLDECAQVICHHHLTVSQLKNLSPDEQATMGDQFGIGHSLSDACLLLTMRVMNKQARRSTGTSRGDRRAFERAARSAPQREQLGPIPFGVDPAAQQASWCRLDEDPHKVASELQSDGRCGAFAVCRAHPSANSRNKENVDANLDPRASSTATSTATSSIPSKDGTARRNEVDVLLVDDTGSIVKVPITNEGGSLLLKVDESGPGPVRDAEDAAISPAEMEAKKAVARRFVGTHVSGNNACRDLSELVHAQAAHEAGKGEGAPLLLMDYAQNHHRLQPWYTPNTSREAAAERLAGQPTGTFLVSATEAPNTYTLSHSTDEGVVHRLISQTPGGRLYTIDDGTPHVLFPTVGQLVDYYTHVRDNDLGVMLAEPPMPSKGAEEAVHYAWFVEKGTPAADVEKRLSLLGEGAFAVIEHDPSDMTASAYTSGHDDDARGPPAFHLLYVNDGEVKSVPIYQDEDGRVHLKDGDTLFDNLPALVASCTQAKADALERQLSDTYHSSMLPPQSVAELGGDYRWLLLHPVSKFQALRLLEGQDDGAFVVRSSEQAPGFYCLSYVFQGEVINELINVLLPHVDQDKGVCLVSKQDRVFFSFKDLVKYYRETRGSELECVLTDFDFSPTAVFYCSKKWGWLGSDLSQSETGALLQSQPNGAFIIRESRTYPHKYLVLCYTYNGRIEQAYIEMFLTGVALRGATQEFPTLEMLVDYYSEARPDLLCALRPELMDHSLRRLLGVPLTTTAADGGTVRTAVDTGTGTDAATQGRGPHLPPDSEELTQASQQRVSQYVRTVIPDVLQQNADTFFVEDPTSATITPWKSPNTLDPRKYSAPDARLSSPGHAGMVRSNTSAGLMLANNPHQMRTHSMPSMLSHPTGSRSHGLAAESTLSKDDTVRKTCRRLGLYSSNFSWLDRKKRLGEIKGLLKEAGDFFILKSEKGNHATLALRVPSGKIYTREIMKKGKEIYLEGAKDRFTRYAFLVQHYVRPSQTDLPIALGGERE